MIGWLLITNRSLSRKRCEVNFIFNSFLELNTFINIFLKDYKNLYLQNNRFLSNVQNMILLVVFFVYSKYLYEQEDPVKSKVLQEL